VLSGLSLQCQSTTRQRSLQWRKCTNSVVPYLLRSAKQACSKLVVFSLYQKFLLMGMTKQAPAITVDEYISRQPEAVQKGLEQMRQTIRKVAPAAEEGISYGMPGFKDDGSLVWYAAFKNHYGLYPHAKAIEVFKEKLTAYEVSKGAIRFHLNKPLPLKLIAEIVRFRLNENKTKAATRSKTRKV